MPLQVLVSSTAGALTVLYIGRDYVGVPSRPLVPDAHLEKPARILIRLGLFLLEICCERNEDLSCVQTCRTSGGVLADGSFPRWRGRRRCEQRKREVKDAQPAAAPLLAPNFGSDLAHSIFARLAQSQGSVTKRSSLAARLENMNTRT